MLAPLHHPVHLAKETATLQELSAGRLLGLGVGWHEDEFRFLGIPFRGRGRRGDEAIRVMRALWRGERAYAGELWSFEDATFAPAAEPRARALDRREPPPRAPARPRGRRRLAPEPALGRGHVRRVKERYPELRVVPRTRPQLADGFLEAGAEGVVVTLSDEAAMRDFVRRYR